MEHLPNEVKVIILDECDYTDCICFRATSSKNYDVGTYVLTKTRTFDFRLYRSHIGMQSLENEKTTKNGSHFNPTKMINFMDLLPGLRKLVLADLPCIFTMSDMIKLGKSLPNLQKCVIIESEERKWMGKDVLMGLTYFKSLEKLKVVNWEPSHVTRRGCASRNETIPASTLRNLINFTIICNKETVSKVLQYLLENEIYLTKCVKAKFNVRLSSPDIPHLIMKFIECHPHIQEIAFNGFLFTTQEQVQAFYGHLLALPQLERVQLENCSVIERIEQALQKTFLDALRRRGIRFTNLVKSLRHG
ncbi:F-box domain-containing protein [Caenorhabditis elegans]|uniref:F-box domain-containing protein n=1 Tax=Caenorhabditis elegans TaxID=6239 RepID=Q21308_CAEEL|nr:F-box domain-containing protein [Caenorhabditis elegans]CCD72131.1 F-box domain-containing protein [Caenorhabditis elegans]|eukprot:NP_510682.2 Uncharacterized protein CELE_K08B5.2 [Caenorhabditis elegans]